MTDLDETAHRLRAALEELVADVPAVAPHPPALQHRVLMSQVPAGRRWGWRRPVALISIAVTATVVVSAVVYFGPRSTPSSTAVGKHPVRHIGAGDAPAGWINLPLLLPSPPAVLDSATVATGPVPVPTAGTYEQVYEGPETTDPPVLLITTVEARPGALADYATGTQAVAVRGTPAYMTNGSHHQLLWQTPDGVVVSLESTGMTPSDVLAAGQLVEPHPATRLGVDVSGALPAGLVFTGEGFAHADTGQNQDTVLFHQGTCHAYTTVWAGSAADFAPVVVVSDATRVLSIGGIPVLSVEFGSSTSALLWTAGPGVDVRLQGGGCDLPGIAAAMKVVDAATWQMKMTSLGARATSYAPHAPTTSATLPGPGTYGLAH